MGSELERLIIQLVDQRLDERLKELGMRQGKLPAEMAPRLPSRPKRVTYAAAMKSDIGMQLEYGGETLLEWINEHPWFCTIPNPMHWCGLQESSRPGIDLLHEARTAACWLASHSRKTGNYSKPDEFLNNWFSKAKPKDSKAGLRVPQPDQEHPEADKWKEVLRRIANDVGGTHGAQVLAIVETAPGEGNALVRFKMVARDYYVGQLSSLTLADARRLRREVRAELCDRLDSTCDPDAQDLIESMMLARLEAAAPVMSTQRFWEDV